MTKTHWKCLGCLAVGLVAGALAAAYTGIPALGKLGTPKPVAA